MSIKQAEKKIPSLHANFFYQFAYWKPSLNIEYPPLYEYLAWDYNRAESIESANWEVMFNNSVYKQVSLVDGTLMNIFSGFLQIIQISLLHLMMIGTLGGKMIL